MEDWINCEMLHTNRNFPTRIVNGINDCKEESYCSPCRHESGGGNDASSKFWKFDANMRLIMMDLRFMIAVYDTRSMKVAQSSLATR